MEPKEKYDSPFLNPDPTLPVNPGHALVVPKRLVATWFEATREEQIALLDGIEAAKDAIEERHAPDGYNIGINVGAAADGKPVDMRKSFDGLFTLVANALGEDPMSGDLFLFLNRRRNTVKGLL